MLGISMPGNGPAVDFRPSRDRKEEWGSGGDEAPYYIADPL